MVTPTLAAHCLTVYDAMSAESVEGVFTGSLTRTFDACSLSRTHYRKVFSTLSDISAITILSRGYGTNATVVQIHERPTMAQLEEWANTRGPHSDKSLLESRIVVVEKLLGGTNILPILQEFDRRMNDLESRIRKLDTGTGN